VTTLRLDVEYEGTRYRGWQEQKNARTVAGELRRALEDALGSPVELGGAGRTDAGVHALGQVAHARTRGRARAAGLDERLAAALPSDIHVLSVRAVDERFHARHAALARSYLYQISRRRTALAKRFVWWVRRPLDAAAMAAGADRLVGRHDFAAFCEKPDAQSSTMVVVERAEIAAAGELVLFRIEASHFLWKMVRRLVGALVELGAGALGRDDFDALLADGGRAARASAAAWTAPPSGLFLERVRYPGEPPLGPVRAAVPVERGLAARSD
jgi:tRNA pseudouridine38-40 synthase